MWIQMKNLLKIRSLLFGIMCMILITLLFSEYFINHSSSLNTYKILTQTSMNKALYRSIQELLQNIYSRNSLNSNASHLPLNENIEFYSKLYSNLNGSIFFNSTETFHKLFRLWLDSRLVKLPLNLSFTFKPEHSCINHGQNLTVLIAVTSKASHIESRLAIRDTWGNFANKMGAKVLFFLGIPPNIKYRSRIIDETIQFQDVIQLSFLDTYANLTYKTISMLKWVSEQCSLVKFVLKVDDDMFINVDNIINITKHKIISRSILGELAHDWPPVRNVKNKWYTSYHEYPFNFYPDFVFGPSYLLSGDVVNILYESSIKMKIFHLEDVFITGFVAEKENIPRINLPAMFNTLRDLQPCQFKKLISSHGHTALDIRRHWMWLTRRNFQCVS